MAKKRTAKKTYRRAKRVNVKFWGSAAAGLLGILDPVRPYAPIVGGAGYAMGNTMLKDMGFGYTVGTALRSIMNSGGISLPNIGGGNGNEGWL